MMRGKLLQLSTEAESILTPKDDSRIMYLGTPQTTFTVYKKLAERNYKPFVWPARVPRKMANYEGIIAPQLQADIDNGAVPWDVTDPDRFSSDDLLEREASMGRSNFMLQFMLDTSLSDAEKFPLKNADLIVTSVNPTSAPESVVWCSDPKNCIKELPTVGLPGDYFYSPMQLQGEWDVYNETICSVDPSGRGSDETTAAYISQRNGVLYLHEMRAHKDGYSDTTLLDILKGCRKYNVTTLLIESNFGDGIVAELFKKHIIQTKQTLNVEETRANVRKEDRIIDTLEPILNQHRLVVDKSVIEWDYASNPDTAPEKRLEYMLFYQMSRMCREKGAVRHDDRIDALAQGVQYFIDALSISAQQEIITRRQRDWQDIITHWEDDLDCFADHLVFNLDMDQRRQSRGEAKNGVENWV